jgi:hypothetical protein
VESVHAVVDLARLQHVRGAAAGALGSLRPELPQLGDAILRRVSRDDCPCHSPGGRAYDPVGLGTSLVQNLVGPAQVCPKGVTPTEHKGHVRARTVASFHQ